MGPNYGVSLELININVNDFLARFATIRLWARRVARLGGKGPPKATNCLWRRRAATRPFARAWSLPFGLRQLRVPARPKVRYAWNTRGVRGDPPHLDIAVAPVSRVIHNVRLAYLPEVFPLAEDQTLSFSEAVRGARERLAKELSAQAEQIQKLNQQLAELGALHDRAEQEAARQWDEMARAAAAAAASAAATAAASAAAAQAAPEKVLEDVLGAVRALMTCTIPEQVLEVLTQEAGEWGVRAAVFDVRGKAAWGAAASGFGPSLTQQGLRSLVVQLKQDSPFRLVCETAGHVDTSADSLKKNRNVLDKLKPPAHAPVLLLPIRSTATVSAILYADPGEKDKRLPVNALKILAEFAGAQIDRLIALSGASAEEVPEEKPVPAAIPEAAVEEAAEVAVEELPPAPPVIAAAAPVELPPVVAAPAMAPIQEAEVVRPPAEESAPVEVQVEKPATAEPPVEEVPEVPAQKPVEARSEEPVPVEPVAAQRVVEAKAAEGLAAIETEKPSVPAPETPPSPAEFVIEPAEAAAPESEPAAAPVWVGPAVEVAPPAPLVERPTAAPPAIAEVSQLSETEQKVHKDAKRFAKLLVSEIELYNKAKVAEGRKNGDLYKRLKSDIDRSRQTFDKRFGKTLNKQFDYMHDELVRTLAGNDSTVLGPDYPGPAA